MSDFSIEFKHVNRAGDTRTTTREKFVHAFGKFPSAPVCAFWNDSHGLNKQWSAWLPCVLVVRALKACKVNVTQHVTLRVVANTFMPHVQRANGKTTMTGEAMAACLKSNKTYYTHDGLKLANGGTVKGGNGSVIDETEVRRNFAKLGEHQTALLAMVAVPMAMFIGNEGTKTASKEAVTKAVNAVAASLVAEPKKGK